MFCVPPLSPPGCHAPRFAQHSCPLVKVHRPALRDAGAVLTSVEGRGREFVTRDHGRGAYSARSTDLINVAELEVVGGGQVPIKDPVIVVDNHAGHCHHSNAPVLPLDSTVALK